MYENNLFLDVLEKLKYYENQGKIVFRQNRDRNPDFFIFVKDGGIIHLKLKKGDKVLSKEQKKYKQKIESINHKYIVVRNSDYVQNLLNNI